MNSNYPKVSVVVASYNSESRSELKKCLESIRWQDYKGELEILVSDGGSTDKSVEISKLLGARVIHNSVTTELGFNGGKNLGIINASGELITIVDADNILMSSDYLTKMVQPFMEDEQVSMTVPMPYVPFPGECTDLCRYFCLMERRLWEDLTSFGIAVGSWIKFSPPEIVVSNGAIIRRSTLIKIGGWDYDTEVGYRLIKNGFNTFGLVKSAERFHIEMLNYRDVWRKYKRRILNQIEESNKKKVSQTKINNQILNPFLFLKNELISPLKLIPKEDKKYYFITVKLFLIKVILGLQYIFISRRFNSRKLDLEVQ